ncbi:cap-specific mRNA (nucleoside-2'-O-)-methyltransferase 2-like [Saccostrea echinata]|uniref:cap-specific mRNA (nucleoside-2'-O-)-methyltransferase 2-like n=1 Tax=Saccostrea echinata TaxID=191078 RepID=UPI002A81793D|nr:cap-specific mRNA (nucleoside-2'-O-)-methyltransferase 2-like [Saccostrea echinata]
MTTMDLVRKRKLSGTGKQLDPSSKQKIKKLFDKKFIYKRTNRWQLPSLTNKECQKWIHPVLKTLKEKLNSVKDKLSDKEIYSWHEHTKFMNIAGSVISTVKQVIRPELCTQAWCKFYEILSAYPLIHHNVINLNTVHLCEAPGAFVTSLNHYLVSIDYSGTWTWLGSTLNPYYEGNPLGKMIDDDRFIRESIDYWYFGEDNTGNLMEFNNFEGLLHVASTMGAVQLVTADGSIDCQDDPGEQEQIVSRLHYCEALAGILILSPGGHLVLKKFTMFDSETISLMFILGCLFEEINVFKPATSKSGNSEVYIVCLNFLGLGERMDEFKQFCKPFFEDGNYEFRFPESCFPPEFLSEHIRICEEFTDLQMETIKCNLDHYPRVSESYTQWMEDIKDACADFYINAYNLHPIPAQSRMLPYRKKKKTRKDSYENKSFPVKEFGKNRKGTFNERKKMMGASLYEQVKLIDPYKVEETKTFNFQSDLEDVQGIESWTLSHGRPVLDIQSSCFCTGKLVQQMNLLQRYKKSGTEVNVTDLVVEALSVLYAENHRPLLIAVSETVQGHITDQNIKDLDFVKSLISPKSPNIERGNVSEKNVCHVMGTGLMDEVGSQKILLKEVISLLQNIKVGDSSIWIFSTCLMRWTAGVVFLLSICFHKVLMVPSPSSSLAQALVCVQYKPETAFILSHLEEIEKLKSKHETLLETIPIHVLLNNEEFAYFLRSSNEYLIKCFISESLQKIQRTDSE